MSGVLSLDAPTLTLPRCAGEGTDAASQILPPLRKRGRVGVGARSAPKHLRGNKKQGKNHAA
ncbi:hypothetical protein [Azospirillum argentinense]